MSQNPAQNEVDALTRRVEAVEDRVEALQVQTGGNFAAVIEGQAALRREVRDGFATVNGRLDALSTRFTTLEGTVTDLRDEMRTGNARILELLASLQVGRDPNQS